MAAMEKAENFSLIACEINYTIKMLMMPSYWLILEGGVMDECGLDRQLVVKCLWQSLVKMSHRFSKRKSSGKMFGVDQLE